MLKSIGKNATIGKKVVNSNGVLYQINPGYEYSRDAFNVIFINGFQYNYYNTRGCGTKNLYMLGQSIYGHNCDCYSDMLKPYGFSFRIIKGYRDNSSTFANSLEAMIRYFNFQNVVLVGKSYGANIACQLGNLDNVVKVVCINPYFLGSSLVDYTEYSYYNYKGIIENFIKLEEQKTFKREIINNSHLAFMTEKACGLNEGILSNLQKTIVFGGIINNLIPKGPAEVILKKSAEYIQKVSGMTSDGVINFSKEIYNNYGIDVIDMPFPYHYNTQASWYNKKIMEKVLQMI